MKWSRVNHKLTEGGERAIIALFLDSKKTSLHEKR